MIFDLKNISYIGKTVFGGDFGIGQNDRRRHLHIIGQTGTGKSTTLLHLISQDLAMGRGIALLDPHGDLAERALTLIPPQRAHQLVYLNPADLARPIGYNLLDQVPEDHRPVVAEGVISAFKHVWPDSWGPRLEHFLLNSIRALLDAPGSTLLCVPRLLTDDGYRTRVVRTIRDPVVRAFWQTNTPATTASSWPRPTVRSSTRSAVCSLHQHCAISSLSPGAPSIFAR